MFRRSASTDDRSPYGEFWFQPIGLRSMSGARVTADSAMRLGAVFRCVSVLSNVFPVMPFNLWLPKDDGSRVNEAQHWLYRLIAKRPNRFQNPFEWRQMGTGHLALRGNFYNEIFANGRGEVTDLIPKHPDRVTIEVMPDGSDYRYKYTPLNGEAYIIPRGRMWHLRGLSNDGIVGISPLAAAMEAIGAGLAAQTYGAQYWANNGAPTGGWLEMPGKFRTQTDRESFSKEWQGARTGGNRHKTPVLESGMKFHELGVKNNEAQFLETRQATVTDICRFFGVPPHLAYDLTGSTNNNIEQQSLEFSTYTMTPIAEMWEASIAYEFLMDEDELEPEFDMRRLMRGDMKAQAEWFTALFSRGAYSPDDIRRAIGEDPVEGGDQRFVPVNMTPLRPNMPASTAKPAPGEDDAVSPSQPKPKNDATLVSPRTVALATAAAERVARREAAVVQQAFAKGEDAITVMYASHAKFVANALGVSIEAAEQYCAARRATLAPDLILEEYELTSRCCLERLAIEGNA